jgi:hypothetical protein
VPEAGQHQSQFSVQLNTLSRTRSAVDVGRDKPGAHGEAVDTRAALELVREEDVL